MAEVVVVRKGEVRLSGGRTLAFEVTGPRGSVQQARSTSGGGTGGPLPEPAEPAIWEGRARGARPGVGIHDKVHSSGEGAAPGVGDWPILLIRPLGGAIELWGEMREVLSARRVVIAFDRAGAGESSDAPIGLGTRGMARDAAAVLDHVGAARAHVFGVSLGGMVATWLAIDSAPRVGRLCLASTAGVGLDLSARGIGRAASLAGCLLGPGGTVQACLVRRILSEGVREGDPGRAARLAAPMEGRPARRLELVKQAAAAALHDAHDRLHSIRAPTLVLAGERDELLGVAPQEALSRAIPGARFEVVAGAGHALTLEAPREVAEKVLGFFAETG